MTKIYPNVPATTTEACKSSAVDVTVLTVWKKSLLFNCDGFTVYDGKGNLVFRVDNYTAGSGTKGEIVLMDAAGKPLLTIRRKRLSLGDNWLVYDGETAVNPLFSVRKHMNILNTKFLAHVSRGTSNNIIYDIEGSYVQRCCAVYDYKRMVAAEIKPKEAVGGVGFGIDVFRLIVWPEIDAAVAMTIVMLLDQMFGSSKRLST